MAGQMKAGVLVLPLLAAVAAGCMGTSDLDPARAEFVENRRMTELDVRIKTLEAKLADERQRASEATIRCDVMERNLLSERELRRQEKVQYDLVVRLKEELQAKLDLLHSEAATLKTLQQDIIKLSDIIKQRDAELARLRAELERSARVDGRSP